MTEIVRSLAQFFMKQFPLDVKERHIPIPNYQNYFAQKFCAVIRGSCSSANDITDKILLANSLLDHASQLFFVGEIGLVALHALKI